MKYKDRDTGEIVEAVQLKPTISSIIEASRFIGQEFANDLYINSSYCNVVYTYGLRIDPYKVAYIGYYIVKYGDGLIRTMPKERFKTCYEPADRIEDIIVHVDLQADGYLALLKEAEQTAEKLKELLGRLNNYKIEPNQSNDRLHCTYILKPGKGDEYINGR